MRLLMLFLGMLMLCQASSGQRIKRLRKANKLYEAKQYIDATQEYEELLNSITSAAVMGVDAKANLADCYRMLGKTEASEKLFREVINEVVGRPDTRLQFAEVLMLNGNLKEAKDELLLYSIEHPDDPRASALSKRCDLIAAIKPVYTNIDIEQQNKVNRRVNDEFGPAICGNSIAFASDRVIKGSSAEFTDQKHSYIKLYLSKINEKGQLEKPMRFPKPINGSNRHDGPATFSRDGKTIIYSQSVRKNAESEELSLQLVSATYENGAWSEPQPLNFVQPSYRYSHPCLSPTGQELYFTSNQSGSHGGTDIWVSRKDEEGTWTVPTNLGKGVNTQKDEGFPYLHPDGTLFFASKGHANYGGYDLFMTRPLGNGTDWLLARNLGVPMNSTKDDTYFLLLDNGLSGYLSSARDGDDNIYRFILNEADTILLPEEIEEPTAPDFSGLETVIELADDPDMSSPEWTATARKDTSESDVDFVDRIIATLGTNHNDTGGRFEAPELIEGNNNLNPSDRNGTQVTENPSTNQDDGMNTPNSSSTGTENANLEPSTTGNTSGVRKVETNPALKVDLYIIDAGAETALENALVKVFNKITQEEEAYTVKSGGLVQVNLLPDQFYEVRATCNDYHGGRLPISTYGAYYTETQVAKFPLIRKN